MPRDNGVALPKYIYLQEWAIPFGSTLGHGILGQEYITAASIERACQSALLYVLHRKGSWWKFGTAVTLDKLRCTTHVNAIMLTQTCHGNPKCLTLLKMKQNKIL